MLHFIDAPLLAFMQPLAYRLISKI